MPHPPRAAAPRRLPAFLLVIALLCLLPLTADAAMAAPPIPAGSPVNAASAILFDTRSGTVLFESFPDTSIAPASLTKIMTMAVTMDQVKAGRLSLDDPVTVSDKALAQGGAYMGIQLGEQVPLRELLLGMAVASGNDAAMAVAEHVGGGDSDAFVAMMNEKARALGMEHTTFVNPHGMPAKPQRTTARDMLLLARDYLERHPEMLEFHNTHFMRHGQRLTWNHNPLLGFYEGADGLKTGWIKKSGYNIVATAQRDDRRLVAVLLGGASPEARAQECCRLFDAAFGSPAQPAAVAAMLASIPADRYRPNLKLTAREAFAHYGIRQTSRKAGRGGAAQAKKAPARARQAGAKSGAAPAKKAKKKQSASAAKSAGKGSGSAPAGRPAKKQRSERIS